MKSLLSFLISVFFIFVSIPASAFIFVKADNTKTYAKGERKVSEAPLWTGKTVTFYVNTNLTALGGGTHVATMTSAELLESVQIAANLWNSVNCRTGLRVKVAGSTTGTFSTGDSQNVVAYDDRAVGSSYCGTTSALACAGSAVVSDAYVDCDISVNGASSTTMNNSGSAGAYNLTTILIHEMGHCLGLDHTYQTTAPIYSTTNTYLLNSIMRPALSAGSSKTTLEQDEKDAFQCIYPSSSDSKRNPCSSYHGTSGGGEISGTVTGGPSSSYTPVCTSDGRGNDSGEQATGTIQDGSASSGCVTSAFAGTEKKSRSVAWYSSVWLPLAVVFLGLRWRRRNKAHSS